MSELIEPDRFLSVGYKNPDVQRAYQREWMARRRSEWIAANGPCVDCGSWDDAEVDHADPTTKAMNPAAIWSRNAAARDAELAKCVVRCHGCHLTKTSVERAAVLRHGTETMYCAYGCRCEPCKAARAKAKKANRERRKAAGLPRQ